MRDPAVAVRDPDEKRHDRRGRDGELPVDDEEHDRDADDREHVLEEEDEPVAEEEADRLQVDGGPGHQLTRLVAVVEAEREAEELGVDRVPQVVFDPERLAPRDEPAAHHEEGSREADREDDERERPEPAAIVPAHGGLERVPGDEGERDRGSLRPDREHDRNRHRPAVGAQEAE
jgi:hypothetical protein